VKARKNAASAKAAFFLTEQTKKRERVKWSESKNKSMLSVSVFSVQSATRTEKILYEKEGL
jgi:hypothetical protein